MFKTHDMTREAYYGGGEEPPQRVGNIDVYVQDGVDTTTPIYLTFGTPRNALSMGTHLTREDATFLRDALNAALAVSDPPPVA